MNPGVPFLFLISGQPDRSSPNCPRDLRAKPKTEDTAVFSLILATAGSYQLLTRQVKPKRQVENRRHQLERFPTLPLCLSVCPFWSSAVTVHQLWEEFNPPQLKLPSCCSPSCWRRLEREAFRTGQRPAWPPLGRGKEQMKMGGKRGWGGRNRNRDRPLRSRCLCAPHSNWFVPFVVLIICESGITGVPSSPIISRIKKGAQKPLIILELANMILKKKKGIKKFINTIRD